jgi:flagellar hook capping protein FlgD
VTVVVLVLVAATSAAFVVSERLKLERAPITAPDFDSPFSPVCDCENATARLGFRFRRPEIVTATVVNLKNRPVQVLAVKERIGTGTHAFVWDGKDEAGELVADGRYRLRLRFERERRSILVPTFIEVDTRAPNLRGAANRDTISPDGDGHADKLVITYRTSERAFAELRVDGQVVLRTRVRGKQSVHKLQWYGRLPDETGERQPAPAGAYDVTLVVRDLAGNETSKTFPLRVRYIELDQNAYTAQVGGSLRFGVDTDAPTYSWYLFRPRAGRFGQPVLLDREATERDVVVSISPEARPGTYVLRVAQSGHRDRANVALSALSP